MQTAALTLCSIDAPAPDAGDSGAESDPTAVLRALAANGALCRYVASSPPAAVAALRSAAFLMALPLVWKRHTRPLEVRRGHRRCTGAISRMEAGCLDGFTDDLEAVVRALLAYRHPIGNLEGWLIMRMANAIKDGNRARRARDMGAQQRVRVPAQLAAALGANPWLVILAQRVLQWVGVRQVACAGLWPLGAWAEERAIATGDWSGIDSQARVAAEVDAVLAAMRQWNSAWYAKYVEEPLGRKWAPGAYDVPAVGEIESAAGSHAGWLDLVPAHERDDGRLADLAAASLATVETGLAAGQEPRALVAEALASNFLGNPSVCGALHERPLIGDCDPSDVLPAILADPVALRLLVAEVMEIVGAGDQPVARMARAPVK